MNQRLPRLFVLGDSISIEYGPHLQRMLASHFHYSRKSGDEQALKNLDIPEGSNGGDSRMCLEFLRGMLESGELTVDLLLLNCGLHDVKHSPQRPDGPSQVPLEQYRENLRAILELLKAHRLPVIWVRTTPVCDAQHNAPGTGIIRYQRDVDRFNEAADAIMTEQGVHLFDLAGFTLSLGRPEEVLRDGRHFHEPIQKLQAAFLAGSLITRQRISLA
jgi:lysophospholipase L1-like esterase